MWTCPVLKPFRDANCPRWILSLVNTDLNGTFSLPSEKLLLFTRALHKSVEPNLAQGPQLSTFNWIVRPERDGVPYGRVYADGSRLFAEHRYFNLLARQGWAFAIVDLEGNIVAAASGTVPWWIVGIYGAELWALLQAASTASPGSPMHVDCNAVRIGAQNGRNWALSPSRKLARAWIPLANILEDITDTVVWLPAHCNRSAIGARELSNGRKFDKVDLDTNDCVDAWAKREAKAHCHTRSDFRAVKDTTNLVEGLATWIGLCTREANHFPAADHHEGAKFIRDSTTRSCSFAKARRALSKTLVGAVKRKSPSASGTAYIAKFPRVGGPSSSSDQCDRVHFSAREHGLFKAKRPKLSDEQMEDKANSCFMEYWLAQKEQAPKPCPPPVPACDRRARVAARNPGGF